MRSCYLETQVVVGIRTDPPLLYCPYVLHSTGEFCQYDHGRLGNLGHYGSITPPKYDCSKISVPVALFWSDGDWLADPQVRYLGHTYNKFLLSNLPLLFRRYTRIQCLVSLWDPFILCDLEDYYSGKGNSSVLLIFLSLFRGISWRNQKPPIPGHETTPLIIVQ